MARPTAAPLRDDHVNVTPLIDVVMCLIIFFLLAGQMARDNLLTVKLPGVLQGVPLADAEGRLIVNLMPPRGPPDAAPSLDRAPAVYVGQRELAMRDLPAFLYVQRSQTHNLQVVLRADSAVRYEFVAPVLASCARANIGHIHFAAVERVPQRGVEVQP